MTYTVKQLSDMAGITPRTLRWYDRQGLLKPTATTEAGYRLYDGEAAARLQVILLYRELEVPLTEVKRMLDDPACDRAALLRAQLHALQIQQQHVASLIAATARALEEAEGGKPMEDQARFEAFKRDAVRHNEERYGAEARKRYGDESVDRSNQAALGMTEAQYAQHQSTEEALRAGLAEAVRNHADPAGGEGARLFDLHKAWLTAAMGRYDPATHRGIAAMYVQDPRFTAYYDSEVAGCAAFLQQAVEAHAK